MRTSKNDETRNKVVIELWNEKGTGSILMVLIWKSACSVAGPYRAGEAGEGACNSVLVSVYSEIQTWPTSLQIAIPFMEKLEINP